MLIVELPADVGARATKRRRAEISRLDVGQKRAAAHDDDDRPR
jgi:hypothetical protein